MDGFSIPGSNGVRRGVHGVDLSHKGARDARGEVLDENIIISDPRESSVILE